MRMKWFFLFLATLLMVNSCTGIRDTDVEITPTNTITTKSVVSTKTPTLLNTFIKTFTPIDCDPVISDYCIEDGTFFLTVPISDSGTQVVDRSYPYGSTAAGTRNPHLGVEFYNPSETPVMAAGDGMVVFTGNDTISQFGPFLNYYGNLVIIEHSLDAEKLFSLYGHLSQINTNTGDEIKQGEKIGEVGSSGSSLGSHLHFELRRNFLDYSSTINPELWLRPIHNTGVLAMRFQTDDGTLINIRSNIQFLPENAEVFTSAWQPEPYSLDLVHAESWENATLGNLLPGLFRISYYWGGILNERWVEIKSNKLTRVAFSLP